ncbi:MAG: 3-hydroxybutyryl-CoA dehydrogenase, partial [Flavobacteriales bacterium]|nr:3-hydroxybutyryl-CoA dehydrogenase [Flavobacteriales bacterium]
MNIAIIGSGTMGSGIAQVAATAGCFVKLYDTNQAALDKSKMALEKVLSRLIEKKYIGETEKNLIQSRIFYVNSLKDLANADLTIEAIIENAEIKQKVFSELESYQSENAIIASNTSSLSITSLAASLKNPERFIGIHFFNPAPLMPLVEIIPAIQTSEEVKIKVVKIIEDWKKIGVLAKDTPGFIVNRVARPFYGEALRIYEEGMTDLPAGEAGFATIDWAMKEMGGFRMGPFELMDFIGN